jgi:hypothetical protein
MRFTESASDAERLGRLVPALRGCQVFYAGDLRAIVQMEPTGWHLSLSCNHRRPTDDELDGARLVLIPLIDVNELPNEGIHPFVRHLYERAATGRKP